MHLIIIKDQVIFNIIFWENMDEIIFPLTNCSAYVTYGIKGSGLKIFFFYHYLSFLPNRKMILGQEMSSFLEFYLFLTDFFHIVNHCVSRYYTHILLNIIKDLI